MHDALTAGRSLRDSAFVALEGSRRTSIFLTCEHASPRLPEGYSWPEADRRLIGTHWTYDLGAAELVHAMAAVLDAPAVLTRFTRLLADANRPEDSDSLFRTHADGLPVALNDQVDAEERAYRLERYYRPYHAAVDSALREHDAEVLFSIHTFTPVYEGEPRAMELGVLFDTEEQLGERLARTLRGEGFVTELNEPYSGKEGLIFAADRHAAAHGRKALELEVRQDLAVDPVFRTRLVGALAAFFRA